MKQLFLKYSFYFVSFMLVSKIVFTPINNMKKYKYINKN